MNRETVYIEPCKWFVVPAKDFDLLAAGSQGAMDLAGGYVLGASSQAAWYPEGTIYEAAAIREALATVGGMPTADQAWRATRNLLDRNSHYDFSVEGEIWRISHSTVPNFKGNPFEDKRWKICVISETQTSILDVEGSELSMSLTLLPMFDGSKTLQEIVGWIGSNPVKRRLLSFLAESGAITSRCSASLAAPSETCSSFEFLGHSGFRVSSGHTSIIVDPLIASDARIPIDFWQRIANVEAVVISHHHWDHAHLPTLARIPRTTRLIVPTVRRASWMNPPLGDWLRWLGFENVEEVDPGDEVSIGVVDLQIGPFRGEPFGLDSVFDAFTYRIGVGNWSLVGTVDACHDERGAMDEVLPKVEHWQGADLFLFGSTGQEHRPAYAASGLRCFTNVLQWHPHLIRYHPNMSDVQRWRRMLKPVVSVPYADFSLAPGPGRSLPWADFEKERRDQQCSRFEPDHSFSSLQMLDQFKL